MQRVAGWDDSGVDSVEQARALGKVERTLRRDVDDYDADAYIPVGDGLIRL